MSSSPSIELWFVRHGQSKNNEILSRAGGLGAVMYPVEFSQDPIITEKGIQVAMLNGQRLKECHIDFDLCVSSSMVRTMETAYYMFIQSQLVPTVHVAPYISEIPLSFGGIPIYENMPLERRAQIEKLGKKHGSEILDALDWSLVQGPTGSNKDTLPPCNTSNGQTFYQWIYQIPQVQSLIQSQPSSRVVRIGVVTHSNLLKDILQLESKPANADIWVGKLHVMRAQMEGGGISDHKESPAELCTLINVEPWFQEHIAIKQELITNQMNRMEDKIQRKIFKYQTKIFQLNKGLLKDEEAEEKAGKKESKYLHRMEKKSQKYTKKLEKLSKQKLLFMNPADLKPVVESESTNGNLSDSSDSE